MMQESSEIKTTSTQIKPTSVEVPNNYFCSITKEIMFEPVIAEDGFTYEQEAIERHLQDHITSPRNRKHIGKKLMSNVDFRGVIEEFLQQHPEHKDQLYFCEYTMMKAIRDKDTQKIKELLRRDPRFFTQELTLSVKPHRKAFHLACEEGSPDVVTAFLEAFTTQRGDIEALQGRPANWRPIHLNHLFLEAVRGGDPTKVKRLLGLGAEVNTQDVAENNASALHLAVKRGHRVVVDTLLEEKGINVEAKAVDESTPLHFSAFYGKIDCMRSLIKTGVDLDAQDKQGNTPLHDAASRGQGVEVQELLRSNANPLVRNANKQTAADLARASLKPEMATLIETTQGTLSREQRAIITDLQKRLQLQSQDIQKQQRLIENMEARLSQLEKPFQANSANATATSHPSKKVSPAALAQTLGVFSASSSASSLSASSVNLSDRAAAVAQQESKLEESALGNEEVISPTPGQ